MIFNFPGRLTHLDIWSPRYKDKYSKELAEPVVLMAKYKVDAASPWIIVEFSKAKHLKGLHYCIKRSDAQSFPIDSNTKIPCYAVPLSKLEHWDSAADVKATINEIGW